MWVPHKDSEYSDSKWSLKTSGSVNASVLFGTVGGGKLLLESDEQPNIMYNFYYEMGGCSFSEMPGGLDISSPNMPGSGTRIMHRDSLLCRPIDFVGLYFWMGSAEGNLPLSVHKGDQTFNGGSLGVITFGANPFHPVGGCWFAGAQLGIPTTGFNFTFGYIIGFL